MTASKVKKCKICSNPFEPRTKFQLVCGYKCANEYAKIHLKKEAETKWKKEKKQLKEKLKTYAKRVNEAKKVFQKWVRTRDANLPCISCGTSSCRTWQGGHMFKAEIFAGLIFDEQNVHKQCLRCNFFLDGNELGYRDGLIKRYGIAYVLELENKKLTGRHYKYSNDELEAIKTKYNKLIRDASKTKL